MARDMAPEAEVADKASIAETRARWIAELRRQGHRQCTNGVYFDRNNNACALGLLAEMAGLSHCEMAETRGSTIAKFAGLSLRQSLDVVRRNDGMGTRTHTFAEIADVVEGWFK